MRLFEAMRRRKATVASVATVSVVSLAVTTMALFYQGITTANVQLNDGGVWVTKPSGLLLGHLNYPSQVLDGGLRMTSGTFDILQNGETVIAVDPSSSTLSVVDPATVSVGNPVAIPAQAEVSLGANTVSVLDASTGLLFSSTAAAVANFTANPDTPLYKLGAGASATVDDTGTIHGLSLADKQLVSIPVDDQGTAGDPVTAALGTVPDDAQLSLATVGTRAVVFDSVNGVLYLPGGKQVSVADSKGGILQQNGPDSSSALIATTTQLISQPLDGSTATSTSSGKPGKPAPPVFLSGCAYGAWAGASTYVRDCAGTANDVSSTIDGLPDNADLVFRVNRDVVVINDLTSGAVWLVNQNMKKVENWDDVVPPPDQTQTNEEDNTTEEELQQILPNRTDQNSPPIAVDDKFGVRAGRTTVLPVLDNDSDPDGDVLTATLNGAEPPLGTVQSILGGAALQIAVPADATGTGTFSYSVDDGRGGKATATVSLTVKAPGTNEAPVEKRVATIPVEQNSTVSYNVLPDWIDPDGDDLFVRSATADGANQVQFRADGQITFTALDADPGRKDVKVVVSDGTLDTEGTIHFEVRASGTLAPVTNADHYITRPNQQVTASPLANDLSPSGAQLRLAKINEVTGATVVPDYTTGTFTFITPNPGTYYVQYLVTDGPKTASGLVRVDVLASVNADDPPIAVRDTALLTKGHSVLVNVLANDFDPAGGILAVQSIDNPADSGVAVEVLEHETLRITDSPGITSPTTIHYTVTNGTKSAVGEVFVIPIPAPAKLLPPVAVNDTVTVRAADVATIHVLDNDYSPNGDTISLSPTLVQPLIAPADGDMFVAQDTLRFKAGPVAKTVYTTYEVVDSQGQRAAGYVTIQIIGNDAGANSPPRPRDVTVRALQGTTVRIPIPLDGIDPDGDSVSLIGQGTAPAKGRITSVGESWLEYEAYPTSTGTDTFTYVVRDRLGAEATATVQVGIVPSASANQSPYAVPDAVSVRPGRTVAVDVLANDSDPDGDPILLRDNGLQVPDGVTAVVKRGRVEVTAPQTPGQYTVQYTVVDQYGATAVGPLLVTVDPNAVLVAPIARDDVVVAADVIGKATTTVPVRENDDDPDGTVDDLTVSSDNPNASITADNQVTVTLTGDAQIVTYTVTDPDGLKASAFIFVPGLADLHPTLKPGVKPITVNSGETISVPLSQYVLVNSGKTARITEAGKVSVAHGNGSSLVTDETTLTYTSQAGYYGPDALSFEVTDGTGPDDPLGKKAVLVIPITVVSTTNISPTFLGGSVNVAPGGDADKLNLRTLSRDPDQGDLEKLSYSVVGSPNPGITASIDGQTLSVSASGSAAKGQSTFQIQVTDGQSAPGTGAITVNVLTSIRPMPSAVDDTIPQADQGKTRSVSVLDNDYNPYPETPLKILDAVVETGNGTASVNGSQVDVTPASDFVGTMVVRYRITDATNDPLRVADGRIRLTVQGRPDTPTTPSVTSIQDKTVVLSWVPPSDNGSSITGYTVKSPQGYSKQCQSTTCTLDGLTNNVEYTFTVTATNAVGTSDASPSSGIARPDARPSAPAAPTLIFGDKSATVNWVTPPTTGSPVTSYNLEISPAPAAGTVQKTGVTGNSTVWNGLENGVAYQVRIQAVNRAPDPSDFSPYSATVIPAGKPDAPAAPTTTRLEPVGDKAQLQVNWVAPANNGDAVSAYTLQVLLGGSVVNTLPEGTATSQAIEVATSESDYTFIVTAANKAGTGNPSGPSAPRRAFVAPGAPGNVSATAGDNQLTVSYSPAAGNGAKASELAYQYSLNNGGWNSMPGNKVITSGVSNNNDYTVRVRAVTQLDGETYNGAASTASNSVSPYGAPNKPSTSASPGNQSVTVNWSSVARNGRDYHIEIKIDSGGWENVGTAGGSRTIPAGYSDTHSITARTVDVTGAVSGESSSSATSESKPTPTATISPGGACNVKGIVNCTYIKITVHNFDGSSVTCTWNSRSDGIKTTSVSAPDGTRTPGWYTDDRQGTGYELEVQANYINCGGVTPTVSR
ncbi:Ig-like domain-containing protein [Subtercola sp. RTI3]|uniref:Ig-like domain-containing protein n=1 Tax=Subtercola sp. RTI3 TaxID=3048639 RepID=UPI002B22B480|nr:Ig-like domain-containing protein [Subtercola sp. RTI3]